MNDLLAVAPNAEVAHGALGCMVSIAELADRPPRPLADGEILVDPPRYTGTGILLAWRPRRTPDI